MKGVQSCLYVPFDHLNFMDWSACFHRQPERLVVTFQSFLILFLLIKGMAFSQVSRVVREIQKQGLAKFLYLFRKFVESNQCVAQTNICLYISRLQTNGLLIRLLSL